MWLCKIEHPFGNWKSHEKKISWGWRIITFTFHAQPASSFVSSFLHLDLSWVRSVLYENGIKIIDRPRLFESNVLFSQFYSTHSRPSFLPPSSATREEDCSLAEKIYEETQFLGRLIRWNWFDSARILVEIIFLFMKMFLCNFCWESIHYPTICKRNSQFLSL